MSYQLYLTERGAAKIAAAATINGQPIKLTKFAVGQGVDVDFTQRLDKQTLVSKRYDGDIQSIYATAQRNRFEVVCFVPSDIGGWYIREIGLFDEDGDLIWVGSLPEVKKPVAGDIAAVDYRIKCVITVDNPDVILTIDTNVIYATQPWVESNFIPRSALELLYPIGHPYWSAIPIDPTPRFDVLFGYPTYWRRVQGVELVAIKDGDTNIGLPHHQTGKQGIISANTTKPDLYPLYPLYLWIRYEPIKYDGRTRANGISQYQ